MRRMNNPDNETKRLNMPKDKDQINQLDAIILHTLSERPMTPDEVAKHLNMNLLTIRPACSDLKKRGRLCMTGVRKPTSSGKTAAELMVVPTKPEAQQEEHNS